MAAILFFQKLLKFVVKMLSQQNLQVPSRRPFCFNLIAPKNKNYQSIMHSPHSLFLACACSICYSGTKRASVWRVSIMITHLHVKSRDDSSNGIAVIGQTIFVENWLWRPSCFSEIAENQYQPSLCHPISVLKVW